MDAGARASRRRQRRVGGAVGALGPRGRSLLRERRAPESPRARLEGRRRAARRTAPGAQGRDAAVVVRVQRVRRRRRPLALKLRGGARRGAPGPLRQRARQEVRPRPAQPQGDRQRAAPPPPPGPPLDADAPWDANELDGYPMRESCLQQNVLVADLDPARRARLVGACVAAFCMPRNPEVGRAIAAARRRRRRRCAPRSSSSHSRRTRWSNRSCRRWAARPRRRRDRRRGVRPRAGGHPAGVSVSARRRRLLRPRGARVLPRDGRGLPA